MIYTSQFDLFLSIAGLVQCEFAKWKDPDAYIVEERLELVGYHLCSKELQSGFSRFTVMKIIETDKNLFITSWIWRDQAFEATESEKILQIYSDWESWPQEATVCGPKDKSELCTGTNLPGSI